MQFDGPARQGNQVPPDAAQPIPLDDDLWLFRDTCNVYVVRDGPTAIAIDFGTGRWLEALPALGIRRLEHVFLTHHHADQCHGLQARPAWPFSVHAPAGEEAFLSPMGAGERTAPGAKFGKGCPSSYDVLPGGVAGVDYAAMGSYQQMFWGRRRLRFLLTPGHGPHASSVLLDHGGKQVVFCGDAVHAGGTLWQPYHLEWDHWLGTGALAAWEGVGRLRALPIDLLCPAHGPVIGQEIAATLETLAGRLMAFYEAKGNLSPGEPDLFLAPEHRASGARQVLDGLYQFGLNGYLLVAANNEALVIDPTLPDIPELEHLTAELAEAEGRSVALTAAVATHYHSDHTDALPLLRERYGTTVWLHPEVAAPLRDVTRLDAPWLPAACIEPDRLLPADGTWEWNEHRFRVAHWPSQTWWHCLLMTTVAGRRVAFSGDFFNPTSRYNGTGGFCAHNRCRFREGYVASARRLIEWAPEVIAAGHGQYFAYRESKLRKIIAWAQRAEAAVTALCPSGDLQDYYRWSTAVSAQ